MTPGQYQMHQNILLAACGNDSTVEVEPDYEEKYEELLDLVRDVVGKNPSTVDSKLVEYLEENE